MKIIYLFAVIAFLAGVSSCGELPTEQPPVSVDAEVYSVALDASIPIDQTAPIVAQIAAEYGIASYELLSGTVDHGFVAALPPAVLNGLIADARISRIVGDGGHNGYGKRAVTICLCLPDQKHCRCK